MKNNLVVSEEAVDDPSVRRLESTDVLAPGYHWRVKATFSFNPESQGKKLYEGDLHLLLDVFEFEGQAHSVEILCHPRNGSDQTYKLMLSVFLENMEPAYDAEEVRARELAEIMQSVHDIQAEMDRARDNPMLLPGVQEAADKAVEKFERDVAAEAVAQEKSLEERQKDLRRIHRRAARRSAAAGNPLVARSMPVSNDLSEMISGGVTSDGLSDLTLEARRRAVIAETSAKWLTGRAEKMSAKVAAMTPYYAEKGLVAIARAKKAIAYAKTITSGLTSLKLYTGDGVDVVTVAEGPSADTSEPLTLFQGKRFMDEELAVHADVAVSFDWKDQAKFFAELASNSALLDQLIPAKRGVITMAVCRRRREYSNAGELEALMNNIRNRQVFLLIRDGAQVHAVYSSEPSHEASPRLFPNREDIDQPFRGIDGSKIKMDQVAFVKSAESFDDMALHYKRFLILLCGLDHRLKLMGEFYPPEKALDFMSLDFQGRYFRFVEDDDASLMLPGDLEPVGEFIARCNKAVRSGSRIVAASDVGAHSPAVCRQYDLQVDPSRMPEQFIAARDGKRHFINIPVRNKRTGEASMAKAWIENEKGEIGEWFLCLDSVRGQEVSRYVHNRVSRAWSIGWIRAFKRAIHVIKRDNAQQTELREYLRKMALDYADVDPASVEELMESAIATWRAAHRGQAAPGIQDTKDVNDILTMMYPSGRIVDSIDGMLSSFIDENGWNPLMLARTGKTRLVLYVEANEHDREPYAAGVYWGWVKRVVVEPRKTKLTVSSTSLVWLLMDKPNPAEDVVRQWDALENWTHETGEPVRLKDLEQAKLQIDAAVELWAGRLSTCREKARGLPLPDDIFSRIWSEGKQAYKRMHYYRDLSIRLLVGVYQGEPGGKVGYLYACASASEFIERYGSKDQLLDFYRISKYIQQHKGPVVTWSLLKSESLLKHYVEGAGVDELVRPKFALREVQLNRKKSARTGPFFHNSSYAVPISLNRSIDVLKGVAPHLRRIFYREIKQRIASIKKMPYFDRADERAAEVRALSEMKYQPKPVAAYLSPLLWDDGARRSMANRYFFVAKGSKE